MSSAPRALDREHRHGPLLKVDRDDLARLAEEQDRRELALMSAGGSS